MKIDVSDAEKTASTLLGGLTTFVLNAFAFWQTEMEEAEKKLTAANERIKKLESEVENLESELRFLQEPELKDK